MSTIRKPSSGEPSATSAERRRESTVRSRTSSFQSASRLMRPIC
ncbi:hypothetical protein [Corallococcus exiguus]